MLPSNHSFLKITLHQLGLKAIGVGVLWAVATLAAFGQVTNPVPLINQPLVPDAAAPGAAAFTLTVNGTGFVSGSVVQWNGHPLATTFVSNKQVTAAVTAVFVANPGTGSVTVVNPTPGGGRSNTVFFTVTSATSSVFFANAPGSPVGVGASPRQTVLADFNGDGIPDLAVVNNGSNTVTVLLGNGDGTFHTASSPATGNGPASVAVGDFNGDGKLDLAVANRTDGTVSILLGNGDGTFQAQTTYSSSTITGPNPIYLITADFNGDGKLDLAVANDAAKTVAILLGNGTGTFQAPVDYPAGGTSLTPSIGQMVATGDFNGDGILDLVVPNDLTNTVSVLLGNANGTFQAQATFATGTTPFFVSVADFNGDGKQDLAVADANCAPTFPTACGLGSISILLNSGTGTFPTHVEYATGNATTSVTAGDFNGDGKLDLVATNFNDNTVSVLLGNGTGTFQTAVNFPTTGTNPISTAAGDFNGDGKLDFAVSNNASNNVSVLLQVFAVTLSSSSSSQSLNFGNQVVNTTSAAQTVTVTNNQTTPLTFSSISTSGNFAETNTCPVSPATLAAGANCTVSVTFTPTTTGPLAGTLNINDNAANSPQTFNLSGIGVNVAQLSSATLNFGNQVVNTASGPRTETLTNFGSTPITITSIVATAPFAQTNNCGTSLAAAATCGIVITFTPTATGFQSGSVTITDSAPLSPQVINLTGTGVVAPPTTCPTGLAQLNMNYGNLPLIFEANLGQTDPQVKFLSRGRGYGLFLTPTEAVLALQKSGMDSRLRGNDGKRIVDSHLRGNDSGRTEDKGQGATDNGSRTTDAVLRMQLLNANANAKVVGEDEQPGKTNYFIGNDPAKWVKHAPTYAKVRYQNVYPGIDLVYYGNQRQVEYDFVLAPGADPSAIRLSVAAVSDRRSAVRTPPLQNRAPQAAPLRIAANGDLLIKTNGGEIRFRKPVVYQAQSTVDSSQLTVQAENRNSKLETRHLLDGRYVLTADNRISFEVAGYDHSKPLIIDPVLSYATYLGGSGDDGAFGIAVDSSCDAYITGGTTSTDFPTSATAKQTTYGGTGASCSDVSFTCGDAFVTKLSPDGTAVVYSTYLGGSDTDWAFGIAVDSTGSAYVAGETASTNFPTTASAFQTSLGSNQKAIVARLSPDGSSLVYSTYLGGSTGDDHAFGIAIDGTGDAYVTGFAESSDFPVTGGAYQTTLNCHTSQCENAFVAKINTNASGAASLVYATYLGGNGEDQGVGIATDASGNAYVTGVTLSTTFPVMNAFQPAFGGGGISCGRHTEVCGDAFLAKLNSTGTALLYSTYLGGSGEDAGIGIAADSSGGAYVTGGTDSSDFPTSGGAFQTTFGGGSTGCANTGLACGDGFAAKIDTTKTGAASLIYSTYLGGSADDLASGIAVDASGNAHVAGITNSFNFPFTPDATQTFFAGGTNPCTIQHFICGDAFVTKLNPTGTGLIFSTYLGGSGDDGGTSLALDSQGDAYVTGITNSTNFPVTGGAFQTTFNGGISDAFVARIAGINHPVVTLSTPSLTFADQIITTTSAAQTVILSNSGTAPLTITGITVVGTNASDFAQTSNCPISPSTLGAKTTCTISVTFTPSATGTRTASISVADNAVGSPQLVTLTGRGVSAAIVTFSPTSLTFAGNQVVGTSSASQTVTLTNTGAGPLVITSIATSSADFTQTNNCPPSLAVSATCTITVTFTPTTSVGGISGSLIVTDDAAGSPHQVSLFGTSIAPQISLSTSYLTFDPRAVGTASTPQTVIVTNYGQVPMHITSIVASSDAAETSTCPISPTATLAPNATCTISITFTPAAVGSNTGTVTINSDAFQSPATVINLSGTGFVARLVPRTLSFVAQPLGTTSAIQTAVFLNTGATALSITSITISGTAFALAGNTCGTSLAGGASCIINITFTPTAVGISGGSLTVVSSAPDGPLSMNLQGTGVTLTFSPQSLGPLVGMLFDNQGVGTTSAAQTTTLTNTAATAVSITGITASAPFAETNTCGTSLAAGASCTISVTFSPTSAGGQSGSVSIASSAPEGTLTFPLFGVGDGLQQSTRILFFGPVAVGSTSAAQTVTLTNTGASAVTVTTIAATGDFAQTNTCGASIAPSANCTVSVTFTPTASGARSSNLSITTSASGAPQLVALFGNSPIVNAPGFMTNVFGPNDDASTPMVPLPFPVNFFGNQYNGLFVNNNGNVTFDQTLGTFTPFDLTSTGQVIIAPFFADVYTSTWPTSGLVTFGADTVNGHAAFGINYFRVNYYAASDKMNTFQLILINRSDRAPGDFDVQFNYGNIAWETGSASGGIDGLGGDSARAGFSNGTGLPNTFFELPGSAINGGLLDTNTQTGLINNSLNSPIPGVYIFNVHAGAVVPPGFALSTTTLTFPTTPVNQPSSPLPVTVSNTGGSSFAITNIATSAGFSQTNNCPATLGPGGTCTVNVVFTPTATGAQTGTLTFTDGAPGSPQTVSLSGTGGSTAQLTLSTISLTLPDTHVNQTCTPRSVTLTNSGTGTLTISNISISGPYTQTNTCPASLAAGASCAVSVTFTPTVVGTAEAGTLTITSNASSSPNTVSLTGNATPACLLLPAVQTVTLLRGTDSTTFSLTHQTQGGDAETPIQLTCTNQAPATCAFNPDAIGAMGVTTLTLSNLKAITADTLLFQTHGDATLDHHTTGLSVLFSDFLIASAPITGTITAGQTASYTMAVEPQNGLQGTVSFNCTGAPIGATCAVTPAAVTLSGTGTQNVTVSVTTTARSFAAPRNTWRVLPPGSSPIGLTLLALLALLAGLAFCSASVSPADRGSESRATTGASNRLRVATMGLGVMLAVVLTWAACGGGGSMAPMSQNALATPAGTYNLTVTGTYSGAGTSTQIVHNTTVTLTVH